jgi:hypothetical protein
MNLVIKVTITFPDGEVIKANAVAAAFGLLYEVKGFEKLGNAKQVRISKALTDLCSRCPYINLDKGEHLVIVTAEMRVTMEGSDEPAGPALEKEIIYQCQKDALDAIDLSGMRPN